MISEITICVLLVVALVVIIVQAYKLYNVRQDLEEAIVELGEADALIEQLRVDLAFTPHSLGMRGISRNAGIINRARG